MFSTQLGLRSWLPPFQGIVRGCSAWLSVQITHILQLAVVIVKLRFGISERDSVYIHLKVTMTRYGASHIIAQETTWYPVGTTVSCSCTKSSNVLAIGRYDAGCVAVVIVILWWQLCM